MTKPLFSGSGENYCYLRTARYLHVLADSLATVRMMVAPTAKLIRTRAYAANPQRSHFILK